MGIGERITKVGEGLVAMGVGLMCLVLFIAVAWVAYLLFTSVGTAGG